MSTQIPPRSPRSRRRREHAWLNGYTVFAVAIMFVLGLWQFLAGLTAVVRDGLYATPAGYTYSFNVAGWGWLVLLLGILICRNCCGRSAGSQLGRYGRDRAGVSEYGRQLRAHPVLPHLVFGDHRAEHDPDLGPDNSRPERAATAPALKCRPTWRGRAMQDNHGPLGTGQRAHAGR